MALRFPMLYSRARFIAARGTISPWVFVTLICMPKKGNLPSQGTNGLCRTTHFELLSDLDRDEFVETLVTIIEYQTLQAKLIEREHDLFLSQKPLLRRYLLFHRYCNLNQRGLFSRRRLHFRTPPVEARACYREKLLITKRWNDLS